MSGARLESPIGVILQAPTIGVDHEQHFLIQHGTLTKVRSYTTWRRIVEVDLAVCEEGRAFISQFGAITKETADMVMKRITPQRNLRVPESALMLSS